HPDGARRLNAGLAPDAGPWEVENVRMSGPRYERLLASTALALILAAPIAASAQEAGAPATAAAPVAPAATSEPATTPVAPATTTSEAAAQAGAGARRGGGGRARAGRRAGPPPPPPPPRKRPSPPHLRRAPALRASRPRPRRPIHWQRSIPPIGQLRKRFATSSPPRPTRFSRASASARQPNRSTRLATSPRYGSTKASRTPAPAPPLPASKARTQTGSTPATTKPRHLPA